MGEEEVAEEAAVLAVVAPAAALAVVAVLPGALLRVAVLPAAVRQLATLQVAVLSVAELPTLGIAEIRMISVPAPILTAARIVIASSRVDM